MIVLTGATGFVGTRILQVLPHERLRVIGRSKPSNFTGNFFSAEILPGIDFTQALNGADFVIHSAARAHIMSDKSEDPLAAFREVNLLGTLELAKQAAQSGTKRFIFISSVKVNGEFTKTGKEFVFDDEPAPQDPYGQSKAEAEEGLRDIAKTTGMDVVIIRPPLVYGPGVKANFAAMMRLAAKNLPIPLGAVKNKRSLVAIDNLVDLIITCIDHPRAGNQIFLVSDDHDVSTTELLRELTIASGKKPCLIPVPMKFIQMIATLLGKKTIANRLCGNLQVDISHTKDTLGWKPPISFQEGIARCFKKDK